MYVVENTESHSHDPHADHPNWEVIAVRVKSINKQQCRKRYHHHLRNPQNQSGRSNKFWSEDEDRALLDAVENAETHSHGRNAGRPNWEAIAVRVKGRNKNQCRDRYNRYLRNPPNQSGRNQKFWSEDEDRALLDAVENTEPHSAGSHAGRPNWEAIAERVKSRNKRQCRLRYQKYIRGPRSATEP